MTIASEPSLDYFRPNCLFDYTITKPHSETVECTIPELPVIGVGDGWGAVETEIESNWEAISWELYIDEHPIALDEFGWFDINTVDPE